MYSPDRTLHVHMLGAAQRTNRAADEAELESTCPSRRAAALPRTVSTFFRVDALRREPQRREHEARDRDGEGGAVDVEVELKPRRRVRRAGVVARPEARRRPDGRRPPRRVVAVRRHVRHPHGGAHELGEEQHARRAVADEADARVRAAAAAAADVDGEGGGAEQREHERVERRAAEVVLAELVLHRVARERADRVARVDVGEERREHAEPDRDDVHRPRDLEVAVRNCAEDEERHAAPQPYGHRDGPGEDLVAVVVV